MGERYINLVARWTDIFCEWKLKNCFGAAIFYSNTLHLWSLSRVVSLYDQFRVQFPDQEIMSCFGHCHVMFTFFRSVVHNLLTIRFPDSFIRKTNQQTDGSCNLTSVTQLLFQIFKKQSSPFCEHIRNLLCE